MDIQKYLSGVKDKKGRNFLLAAMELGIKFEVVSEDFRLLRLSWKQKTKILYKSKAYFNMAPSVYFTKNKEITKILLRAAGIKVPTGIYAKDFKTAIRLMQKEKIFFPVVVKPIDAAEGFCVTVGVKNKKELASSVKKIRDSIKKGRWSLSGMFMVEELIGGDDFRILVLNNKIIACAKRVPAHVVGDGKSKILELIKKYNSKRPPAYLLKVDGDVRYILKENGLSLNSVPAKRQQLQLRKNANISTGGLAIDKTGKVSRRFRNIALKSVHALGLNYAGIDIMTKDISSNDPRQPYNIIEINGDPDYDPHGKPIVAGKGVDVSQLLVKEFMKMK